MIAPKADTGISGTSLLELRKSQTYVCPKNHEGRECNLVCY